MITEMQSPTCLATSKIVKLLWSLIYSTLLLKIWVNFYWSKFQLIKLKLGCCSSLMVQSLFYFTFSSKQALINPKHTTWPIPNSHNERRFVLHTEAFNRLYFSWDLETQWRAKTKLKGSKYWTWTHQNRTRTADVVLLSDCFTWAASEKFNKSA